MYEPNKPKKKNLNFFDRGKNYVSNEKYKHNQTKFKYRNMCHYFKNFKS